MESQLLDSEPGSRLNRCSMTSPTNTDSVVDVHAHLVPLDESQIDSIEGVRCVDKKYLEVDGHTIKLQALYQPEALINWMDENGIGISLISIPPPLYRQHLDENQAEAWLTYINNGLQAIAAKYPEKFKVLAHLPLEHAQLALAEAKRRHGELYAGYSIAAGGIHSISYSSDTLHALWQSLHEKKSFVFMHPGNCCDERLKDFYGENLLGNPYETAVAVSQLVFAGVLENFCDIRFCLAHCGGVVPAVAGRWQQGFDTERPGVNTNLEPPSVALKRFYVDCIAHDPNLITLATNVFGKDKILFGSDWPFPMGIKTPNEKLAQLDTQVRKSILFENYQHIVNK